MFRAVTDIATAKAHGMGREACRRHPGRRPDESGARGRRRQRNGIDDVAPRLELGNHGHGAPNLPDGTQQEKWAGVHGDGVSTRCSTNPRTAHVGGSALRRVGAAARR
jgi:hypothetical protein